MIKNEYRRGLIMLRPIAQGYSGHVRLERRTLMGSMYFIVNEPDAPGELRAALAGQRNGEYYAADLGVLRRDGRGQATLAYAFDPRDIDGRELEAYIFVIIARLDGCICELVLSGNVDGAREADFAAVRQVVCETLFANREPAADIPERPFPILPQPPARPEPERPSPRPPARPEPERPSPRPPARPEPERPSPQPPARPEPERPSPQPPARPEPERPSPQPPARPEPERPSPQPPARPEPERPSPQPPQGDRPDGDGTNRPGGFPGNQPGGSMSGGQNSPLPGEGNRPGSDAPPSNRPGGGGTQGSTDGFNGNTGGAMAGGAQGGGSDGAPGGRPSRVPDDAAIPAFASGNTRAAAADSLAGIDATTPWASAIEGIRELFATQPREDLYFDDDFVYVRAPMPEGSGFDHVMIGLEVDDGRIEAVRFALPARFTDVPPAGLENYVWMGGPAQGWWVLTADPQTGRAIEFDD